VNNVETLANMPAIVNMGGDAYAKIGVRRTAATPHCSR